jgi:hypothetical protein
MQLVIYYRVHFPGFPRPFILQAFQQSLLILPSRRVRSNAGSAKKNLILDSLGSAKDGLQVSEISRRIGCAEI